MDDRYAINAAKTELREGYNNADVERILSVFAEGFTDMTSGRASCFGMHAKTVLRTRLDNLFRNYQVELAPTIMDIAIAGDLAAAYGWHVLTLRSKVAGPPEVKRTRYAEIWQRDSNLAWHIIFLIDNADQKPDLLSTLGPPQEP